MKFKNMLMLILFCVGIAHVRAQERLTLEDAVKIALENNFDIRLSRNDVEISENNVSRGNAGFLPSVTATATNNNSIQNTSQTRETGVVTTRNSARGSSLNYGVGLNWTLFDGFGMFARYDQLKELQRLGEANLQLTVINTVGDVIRNYYDIVQQQQQLIALDTAVALSRLRVRTAQTRFEIGKAARLEVLNAQVDYNTDTTSYLRQLEQYRAAKIALNQLLARDVNTEFTVSDSFAVDSNLVVAKLEEQALRQNPSLQAALISRRIAELDLKVLKAQRYPSIDLNTGYNFSRSQAFGIVTSTRGRGFNYGLSASFNIFNGFFQRRNEKNAEISIQSAQLDFERINQGVRAQLATAYQTYLTNLGLVNLEENNQKIAAQNLDITFAKYRLGAITQVEIRDAQLNYVNANVRLNTARYQAKLAEISLREISGSILL